MPGGGGTSQTAVNQRRGGPQPGVRAGVRRGCRGDAALPGAPLRTDAQCDPGRRCHCCQYRPGEPGGISRHPARSGPWSFAGPHRCCRGDGARHPERAPGGGAGVAGGAHRPRQSASRPRPGTKAGHQRLPPPFSGAPGRRDLPRSVAAAAGGSDLSLPTPIGWDRRYGHSSPSSPRRCWSWT